MPLPSESPVPGARFRYLRWAGLVLASVVLVVGIATQTVISVEDIIQEGGFLEALSVSFWFVAILFSLGAIFLWRERDDRLTAAWMGVIALMAGLRELDLHHFIRPDYLNSYGVHFRIKWWLDGNVSLALKTGWALIFAIVLVTLAYPPLRVRLPVLQMARRGNAMVGALLLAVFLCGLGGFIDDRLREATFVSRELRQLTEETSELLGAMAFAASAWLRLRFPLAEHVQSAGLSARPRTS